MMKNVYGNNKRPASRSRWVAFFGFLFFCMIIGLMFLVAYQ